MNRAEIFQPGKKGISAAKVLKAYAGSGNPLRKVVKVIASERKTRLSNAYVSVEATRQRIDTELQEKSSKFSEDLARKHDKRVIVRASNKFCRKLTQMIFAGERAYLYSYIKSYLNDVTRGRAAPNRMNKVVANVMKNRGVSEQAATEMIQEHLRKAREDIDATVRNIDWELNYKHENFSGAYRKFHHDAQNAIEGPMCYLAVLERDLAKRSEVKE